MQPYRHPPLVPAPVIDARHPLSPADMRLHDAIRYAPKYEVSALIDEALAHGARLNRPDNYELNALVIAVRADNHHAIAPLLARGAIIPPVPPEGMSLLMEASRFREADTAAQLIKVAHMDINARDSWGRTALHYATFSDSGEAVTLLLEHGADPDARAHRLSWGEAVRVLGHQAPDEPTVLTPLMIATSSGNEELVRSLLDAGADANLGSRSPLVIAATGDDQAIFQALLDKGADLGHCRDEMGRTGLYACIASHMHVQYVSELVAQHDFSDDDGSVRSPLGVAVQRNLFDVCALLLECGAPVEDHHQTSEPKSIWEIALPGGLFSSQIATLLTGAQPREIDPDNPEATRFLLNYVVNHINHPAELASSGMFTSLLFSAHDKLQALATAAAALTESQKALEAAYLLRSCLVDLPPVRLPADTSAVRPHTLWQRKTEAACEHQRNTLKAACDIYIAHCKEKLADSLTLAFFMDCVKTSPEEVSIRRCIADRVAHESGMPDQVVNMVADAWNKAARLTVDWRIAPDDEAKSDRFLQGLMRNLLKATSAEPMTLMTVPKLEAKQVIDTAFPRASDPLDQFCVNPAAWLRKFEQRHSLADPDASMAYALQPELALPYEVCEQIALAWQTAVRDARRAGWTTPHGLQATVEGHLALRINGKFPGEAGNEFVSAFASADFLQWHSRTMSSAGATTAARKRPAETEAPNTPAAKVPRTSPDE